jgi:hypothetical protein
MQALAHLLKACRSVRLRLKNLREKKLRLQCVLRCPARILVSQLFSTN